MLPLEGEVPEQESLLDEGETAGGDAALLPIEDAETIEGAAAGLSTTEVKAESAEARERRGHWR